MDENKLINFVLDEKNGQGILLPAKEGRARGLKEFEPVENKAVPKPETKAEAPEVVANKPKVASTKGRK